MTFLPRSIKLSDLLSKKSFFLLGPRATGKSSLIREQLGDKAIVINLLRADVQLRLLSSPHDLESLIDAQLDRSKKFVVIDEIQKIPLLLDEVHRLIEERRLKFLLTGSSARKLRAGAANLLGGRAWTANLFPLTYAEIPKFDLDRYLRFGGLPHVWLSEDPEEELDAYVNTYLSEEIKAEGVIRKIPAFAAFLRAAALTSGKQLNFAKIASDTGVSSPTVTSYYEILEDTLIGFFLKPWRKSRTRKSVATGKFYFFDTGVTNALAQTKAIDRNSDLFGALFEQWIGMELRAYMSYLRLKDPLCFWRTESHEEVDFLIGDHTAIEVKASRKVRKEDLKGLKALAQERVFKKMLLVSHDSVERKVEGIHCLHWKSFVERLWNGKIINSDCP